MEVFDITTLSICIISKNEEKNIERCIKSIKEIAEEIILVDTGSKDNTVDLAEKLGAKIIKAQWNNDFSEIRNISISNANMEWILVLDCDEILREDDRARLKNLINGNNSYKGYYIKVKNIIKNRTAEEAVVFRLFKNNKSYKFKGKLHEQIVESIKNLEGNDKVSTSNIEILHYGYDYLNTDRTKKSKRNLEILLSYDDSEKDGYYYYVLGNEFARIDNNKQAIINYEESLKFSKEDDSKIYYPYLLVNLCKVLYKEKEFEECIKNVTYFTKRFNDLKDLYFLKFLCEIELMSINEAKEALQVYLSIKDQNINYPSTNFGEIKDIEDILNKLKAIS